MNLQATDFKLWHLSSLALSTCIGVFYETIRFKTKTISAQTSTLAPFITPENAYHMIVNVH